MPPGLRRKCAPCRADSRKSCAACCRHQYAPEHFHVQQCSRKSFRRWAERGTDGTRNCGTEHRIPADSCVQRQNIWSVLYLKISAGQFLCSGSQLSRLHRSYMPQVNCGDIGGGGGGGGGGRSRGRQCAAPADKESGDASRPARLRGAFRSRNALSQAGFTAPYHCQRQFTLLFKTPPDRIPHRTFG